MKKILLLFVFLLTGACVMAKPDFTRKADFSVLTRTDTAYRFHTLKFASADGLRHYRVYVGIPGKPAPADGFPVFYSLDGNAVLESLTPPRLQQLAEYPDAPVLVLLGYDTDLRLNTAARAFDYTPFNPDTANTDVANQRPLGGAGEFLRLLRNRIMPAVAAAAPVNAGEQTLYGHSFGGLFVLYTLFEDSGLFRFYAAADPALWAQDGTIVDGARTFADKKLLQTPATLIIMKSGKNDAPRTERGLDAKQQAFAANREKAARKLGPDAVAGLVDFLDRQVPDLTVCYRTYPEDTHGSLFVKSFLQSLLQPVDAGTCRPRNRDPLPPAAKRPL